MSRTPFAGLCSSCGHARTIETRTGSVFLLCEKSRTDPTFPRYPKLPVLSCTGYDPRGDPDAPAAEPGR